MATPCIWVRLCVYVRVCVAACAYTRTLVNVYMRICARLCAYVFFPQ